MAKVYVGLEEAADVLLFSDYFSYRWGRAITAYSLSKGHDCSVYRARKILAQLVSEGLMAVSEHHHRKNAFRRDYHVNAQGEAYYKLFGHHAPSDKSPGFAQTMIDDGANVSL